MEFSPYKSVFGFCRSYQPQALRRLQAVMANSIAVIIFYHGAWENGYEQLAIGNEHLATRAV